jgi:hypothetical protein
MSNLFQKLELEAFRKGITPRTAESMNWFRKKASQLGVVNRNEIMNAEEVVRRNRGMPQPGDMIMYFYDPKHKRTLPYYDKFPCTVVVGPAKNTIGYENGFHGLNLHYLPPILRAKLFDALLENLNNKKYDETTRIQANYELLKSSQANKYFRPCFKHYLIPHIRSRFAIIQPPEWEIAVFLPTAQWEKASQSQVWKDSRRMMNG